MSTYSPLITPEDITQERELMKLTRPERFRKWTVSRASVVNELLRREHGRRMQRGAPEPIGETDPPSREPGPCPVELAELRAAILTALDGLPERARRIASRIARGRAPSRAEVSTLRTALIAGGRLAALAEHL